LDETAIVLLFPFLHVHYLNHPLPLVVGVLNLKLQVVVELLHLVEEVVLLQVEEDHFHQF